MSIMDRLIREAARLNILETLADEVNESLASDLLRLRLETIAISRPRAWVHGELDYLAEMGAVTLIDAGSQKIATLTEKGRRHLDRSIAIEGVKRPDRPGV